MLSRRPGEVVSPPPLAPVSPSAGDCPSPDAHPDTQCPAGEASFSVLFLGCEDALPEAPLPPRQNSPYISSRVHRPGGHCGGGGGAGEALLMLPIEPPLTPGWRAGPPEVQDRARESTGARSDPGAVWKAALRQATRGHAPSRGAPRSSGGARSVLASGTERHRLRGFQMTAPGSSQFWTLTVQDPATWTPSPAHGRLSSRCDHTWRTDQTGELWGLSDKGTDPIHQAPGS